MIIDLIVTVTLGLLGALLSLAPPWTLPTESVQSGSEIGGYLRPLNFYFPVTDLLVAILAVLAFSAALTLWHLLVFVYDRLPFKAT